MAGESKQAEEGGKRSRRGIVIAAGAAAVLAAGGAGAWFFLGRQQSPGAEAAAPARKPAVFVDLDPFTVNLADPGGERFAQVGLVLEVSDGGIVEPLKQDMPRLRNGILLLLSSKTGDELLSVAGKQALAGEIAALAGESAGWKPAAAGRQNPVAAVHFSKFIVQ